jgi:hypothetical protein
MAAGGPDLSTCSVMFCLLSLPDCSALLSCFAGLVVAGSGELRMWRPLPHHEHRGTWSERGRVAGVSGKPQCRMSSYRAAWAGRITTQPDMRLSVMHNHHAQQDGNVQAGLSHVMSSHMLGLFPVFAGAAATAADTGLPAQRGHHPQVRERPWVPIHS